MMENLKIYIDRLKGGHPFKIDETLPPEFLEVKDDELLFKDPIRVSGEAYLADDHLIIHLAIETAVLLPCSICNDPVVNPIHVKNIYLTEPVAEIKSAIYDLANHVRETVLLQTPLFTECNRGKCPERENLKKFLKTEEKSSKSDDITYFPFADLH